MTRIFLSYSRGDDEPFVRRLYNDLQQAGFQVWWDRESLYTDARNFHQHIKDAIRERVDRLIYIAGPKAVLSDYVREEWKFALEADKVVIPILRVGDFDALPGELSLLHCDDFRDDTQYARQLARIIENLHRPEPPLGKLYAVPSLPLHFLGRPELPRKLRDAVRIDLNRQDLHRPVGVTGATSRVGLQGMGGIGKSVVAAAVARDREVRRSYPDGVIWITFGPRPNVAQLMRDMVRYLGSQEPFESEVQGQGILRQLLLQKAVFLVFDDVWNARDVQAFDVLGPGCRALITTRDAGILNTLHGELYPVDLFTEAEALQLLADSVNVARKALPPEASEIVHECGCLPLAVALCGGMAKAGHAWKEIVAALREADLEWPEDRAAVNEQHRTIWNAMKASYDVLRDTEKPRFAELAVFATDRTVPEAAVQTLWEHTGQINARNCSKLLISLTERSLIQLDQTTDDSGVIHRRISLHDLLHDFAVRIAGEPKTVHQKLLDAYRKKCPDRWHTGPDDGYFFQNLCQHLSDIAGWMEAETTITDFPFLMRKCELRLFETIQYDFSLLMRNGPSEMRERLRQWADFFREKAHILRRGNEEWPAHKILLQLTIEHADDSPLTYGAERWLAEDRCDWLWLRRVPRLPHAQRNPCLVVLEGHSGAINGALAVDDGRILSWSSDNTLRVWDRQNGRGLAVLKGHSSSIEGCLWLTADRILSWSCDRTLRLWDAQSGKCFTTLEGHSAEVRGALFLPGCSILSWSDDRTLRLWDGQVGRCLAVLGELSNSVQGVLALADSKILTCSSL